MDETEHNAIEILEKMPEQMRWSFINELVQLVNESTKQR